jgi:starch synthase
MSAAIHFESEAYHVTHGKPMGRHFAGHGFLSAFARHASSRRITGYVATPKLGQEFCSFIQKQHPHSQPDYIVSKDMARLKEVGCLYTPSPINASQAWTRELHGANAWSLCGVNHTLSSARIMDRITSLLTAPVQPWDAIICTSTASRDVIQRLFERQAEYLSRRLGATRFVTPQLPVIPLGVDCAAQAGHSESRDMARADLGLRDDDIVVLFLGRLSFHAKANPAPMYLALERLTLRRRIVLIECGWAANDQISQALADARAELCPSVRSIVLDGREAGNRMNAWAAADIFCSLSDNVQETFGLTPIEAMAAGLPVVVSDWDGYKDTVRDGIDGFRIPTIAPPSGVGRSLAYLHALEVDSYDMYIARTSMATAVDVDAAATALGQLADDPDLRRRMGSSGALRAREVFDWPVIVRSYEKLWDELGSLRAASHKSQPSENVRTNGFWPARPDPFELFASFPTTALLEHHHLVRPPDVEEEQAVKRLGLEIAMANKSLDGSIEPLLHLWKQVGPDGARVRDIMVLHDTSRRAAISRQLLLLAKLGLIRIDRTG